MDTPQATHRLNEAQMTLLELFQSRNMTPEELESLKDTLVRHLTDELDQEVEKVMRENNQTPTDIQRRTEAMNDNRTEYKQNVRHSLKGEFATAYEAGQAKTTDLMKTLEKTDLSFLKRVQ